MKTLKYQSRGTEVRYLEEVLTVLGYTVQVSAYFGLDTDLAVRDFQRGNSLVIDGIVGIKTWSKLLENHLSTFNGKLLSEADLESFAQTHNLELAAVKAVNEVESSGRGFLLDGRPVILFEGHIFWRQLEKSGIDPRNFAGEATKDILYPKWTKNNYKGGAGEYERLERALHLSDMAEVANAAFAAASWGAYQIMGFHYRTLGFDHIQEFVRKMHDHEREHLRAFGKFIEHTAFRGKSLMEWLRERNWASFAHGYNGPGYRQNNYDGKLNAAYQRYRDR